MTNVSNRHRRAALKAPPVAAIPQEYMITDPNHKADLRGELGGGKVYVRADKQYVKLTQAQAKFYQDSGALVRVVR